MTTERSQNIAAACAVFVCFCFVATLFSYISYNSYYWYHPKYAVGDCLTNDSKPEPWEKPIVTKIIAIGNESYRVIYWLDEWRSWGPNTFTEAFILAHKYSHKIDCPDKK